ncbi:class I adenylate-forming enzyme family protein [Streptomyces varsoviensis]|nr:AMP-binding protein [Streptomyces varsoviensis]
MQQQYMWNPWRTAERYPDRTAVVADEEALTFGELTGAADRLGRGLALSGLHSGAMVSTDIPPGPRFFALALAALKYGYGLFPCDTSDLTPDQEDKLLTDMEVAVHVSASRAEHRDPALCCPVTTDGELSELGARVPLTAPVPAVGAGYLAFSTSGTTGVPQGVPRARPRRPYRGVAVAPRYEAGTDRGPHLMASPTYHLGTLGPALYALQAGSAVVVQRAWSPAGFAGLIDRHAADSAMLSPDLLLAVVEAGHAPAHRLRALFHGGSACPPAVKRAAIALLGPVLHEYYGTSRSTLTEITTPEWLAHPGSVGRPLAGIRVEIRQGERALPPGETGEICVRLREIDRRADDPPLLRTGDLGFMDRDGYLFVVGRDSAEHPVGAARLEYEVRLLPAVTDVAVLGGGPLVCLVETRGGRLAAPGLEAEVRRAAEALGLPAPRVEVAATGTLPRTPSGKLRRTSPTGDAAAACP